LPPDTNPKIALACDHRGLDAKGRIAELLKKKGYEVMDCGTHSLDAVDYPDFIFAAAKMLSEGKCFRAIGVCYTGIGSSIAANKVKGVRASLVHSVEEAGLTRAHNDSNMLILGAGFLDPTFISPIVEKWLATPFEGGRHEQRVNKIKEYEQKHWK
jgi:ribose 5-phosphate isomerase B